MVPIAAGMRLGVGLLDHDADAGAGIKGCWIACRMDRDGERRAI